MAFVRNLTGKEIGPLTYDGFNFYLPVGTSAIWDDAAEHITTKLFKIEATNPQYDGGAPIPPVIPAEREQWDGKTYARVERFQMNAELIKSRNSLMQIARRRGVDKEFLERVYYDEGEEVENEEIVRAINELPVPDYIQYPEHPQSPEEEQEEAGDETEEESIEQDEPGDSYARENTGKKRGRPKKSETSEQQMTEQT